MTILLPRGTMQKTIHHTCIILTQHYRSDHESSNSKDVITPQPEFGLILVVGQHICPFFLLVPLSPLKHYSDVADDHKVSSLPQSIAPLHGRPFPLRYASDDSSPPIFALTRPTMSASIEYRLHKTVTV
mmetsp:Transcript_37544/g.68995  ORF Transcript_37544/g.68995 Transcript_37544/m.68995 type:complete len:129 (+) Transcript_37544:189-575(+)